MFCLFLSKTTSLSLTYISGGEYDATPIDELGHSILNSIELAKRLDQLDYGDFRATEYHRYSLYMHK